PAGRRARQGARRARGRDRAGARPRLAHQRPHPPISRTENQRGSLMTAARESIGRPDDHVIVLFGATGDLARRKLLPGLFHLAAPPVAFGSLVSMLGSSGLAGRSRVIVEKPFGNDLPSARALNEAIHAVFEESQIFRIDHFLGKESVENVMALRFANGLL